MLEVVATNSPSGILMKQQQQQYYTAMCGESSYKMKCDELMLQVKRIRTMFSQKKIRHASANIHAHFHLSQELEKIVRVSGTNKQ